MPQRPLEFIYPGMLAAQAIHTAVELGIPDLLASGPRRSADLATECKAHAPTLERLLRALVTIEVFHLDEGGLYRNTPFSETLRTGHPQSLRASALYLPSEHMWRAVGNLGQSVQNGQPAFDQVFGIGFFDYLAQHPKEAEIFDRVMTQEILWTTPAILRAYNFSVFETLVDMGGGAGLFLGQLLRAVGTLKGILFDRPNVVERAKDTIPSEIAARFKAVGGSFFEQVPEGADAYVLRRVIHNWSDHDASRILSNVRSAMSEKCTLLIIEGLIDSPTHPVGIMDLMMLVLGGKERTRAEFERLVEGAGFKLNRVVPAAAYCLLECKPC